MRRSNLLPELSKLIEVQELDKVIQEVTGELERLPDELKTEEAALEDLKAQQAAHLQELEDLQRQRRDTETETAEMEDGIKKSRARLMEIKSNIEYKAMLKEIAFKEDQRDQRETRILELMEQMEAQKRALAETEAQIKERQAVLAQQRQQWRRQVEEAGGAPGGPGGAAQEAAQRGAGPTPEAL